MSEKPISMKSDATVTAAKEVYTFVPSDNITVRDLAELLDAFSIEVTPERWEHFMPSLRKQFIREHRPKIKVERHE